jgi:MFS family permease
MMSRFKPMAMIVDAYAAEPSAAPALKGRPYALGRRASFLVSAGVVAHTLWTSAAPAMVYRLYAAEWHLTSTVTTALFAIYPVVVVTVLVGFGNISDHIGRRATMLLGLAASLAGVLLFAVGSSLAWLFVGRALMGIGVGLTVGPSTAAVAEFSPAGRLAMAGVVTAVAQAAGVVCALLIGGLLIQYAPFPTHLPFWVLAGVLAPLIAATWFLPGRSCATVRLHWRPQAPSIPADLRLIFAVSSIAVTLAFMHGAMILSLGDQIAHNLLGSDNAFVTGSAISLFPLITGAVSIAARPLHVRVAVTLGALVSLAGMGCLSLAASAHSVSVFLLAMAASGASYGLLLLGGLQAITSAAPPRQRGRVLSGLFLVAYLFMGAFALAIGDLATTYGLGRAVDVGAAVVGLLSLAAFGFANQPGLSDPRISSWESRAVE